MRNDVDYEGINSDFSAVKTLKLLAYNFFLCFQNQHC